MQRSHALRAAVTATLIELIVVAGASNQWSTREMLRNSTFEQQAPLRVLREAAVSLGWRFTSQHGATDAWLGGWIGDVVLVVLTFLVVFLVVAAMRRPAPFFASWLAAWALIVFAAVIDAIVRVAIGYPDLTLPDNATGWRFWDALMFGPTGPVVVFGLVSGIVAGLGAAIAARSAGALPEPERPQLEPEVLPEPPPPPPWYGEPADTYLPHGPSADTTQALPRVGEQEQTQALPREREPQQFAPEHDTQQFSYEQETAQLPPPTEPAPPAERRD